MAKAIRIFHLLPVDATAADTHGEQFDCGVGGHPHLSFEEIYGAKIPRGEAERQVREKGVAFRGEGGLLAAGEIDWLCFPSVLKLAQPLAEQTPRAMASDASARHGQYVAGELARTTAYAARNYLAPDGSGKGCHPLEVPGQTQHPVHGEPSEGRLALAWPHLFVNGVSTRRRF